MKRLYGIKCKQCTRAAIFVLAALLVFILFALRLLCLQLPVRILQQLFVSFFYLLLLLRLQSAKAKKFTQHRARLSKAKSVKFL